MTCSCRGLLITSDFGHIIYKQVYKDVAGFSWFLGILMSHFYIIAII
jgi:hypothetical protein